MSIDRYFDKFPIIQYANTLAVNITERVAIMDVVYNNPYVFYPYDLSEFERPDQFANRYYNDSFKSWIVYISNKIIDPYYGWYMQQDEFNDFLVGKYGSLENANKIKYYTNNWVNDEPISASYFQSLPANRKAYFTPNYNNNGNVLSYTRKEADWTVNTNRIISYTGISNTSFNINESVIVYFDVNNIGHGQVLNIDTTNNILYIQHTNGTVISNSTVLVTANSYVQGSESNCNSSFSTSSIITENIPLDEEVYWSPVSYTSYENEKNEFNKTIKVLDSKFSTTVVQNLTSLLSSNT
jgi:hypothetical protein